MDGWLAGQLALVAAEGPEHALRQGSVLVAVEFDMTKEVRRTTRGPS